MHGSYVAFQPLWTKRSFLSCYKSPCRGGQCPRMYMEGSDWNKCYGEVFKIYRMRGLGKVRAGDVIAINYPRERGRWFGCSGKYCHGRAACPGKPTSAYGMQSEERWYQCFGEVFKIYAKGRALGAPIYANDDVMLFYVQSKHWVGLVGKYANRRTCPGTVRPPPSSRYECWGEVFELWRR